MKLTNEQIKTLGQQLIAFAERNERAGCMEDATLMVIAPGDEPAMMVTSGFADDMNPFFYLEAQ